MLKGKVVPLHFMKAYIGVALLVPNFGTRWRAKVNFTPLPLYLLEITLEAGWAPEPLWTFRRRQRFLTSTGVKKERQKGREDEEGDVSSYLISVGKEKVLEVERGGTRSHALGNSLWTNLGTCCKTDDVMMVVTGFRTPDCPVLSQIAFLIIISVTSVLFLTTQNVLGCIESSS
jgi:hypothetical protein